MSPVSNPYTKAYLKIAAISSPRKSNYCKNPSLDENYLIEVLKGGRYLQTLGYITLGVSLRAVGGGRRSLVPLERCVCCHDLMT